MIKSENSQNYIKRIKQAGHMKFTGSKGILMALIIASPIIPAQAQLNGAADALQKTRYNRVEGLHLGYMQELRRFMDGRVRTSANIGYGFTSEEATYGFRTKYRYGRSADAVVNATVFKDVKTFDGSLLHPLENSASALFLKEDFFDYFLVEGFGVNVAYPVGKKHSLFAGAMNWDYTDIRGKPDLWSFADWLGSDKRFRANLPAAEGVEHRLTVGYRYDSRINKFFPGDDISLMIALEQAGHGFAGDFEYYGLSIRVKKNQRTFAGQRFVLRGAFRARDALGGTQHLFYLGGIGTLRGYRHKEFSGNRAIMANIDYFFNRSLLRKIPLGFLPFYNSLSLVLFADAGWTNLPDGMAGGSKSFEGSDVNVNVGVGFNIGFQMLRLNIAKPLESGEGIRVTARMFQRL